MSMRVARLAILIGLVCTAFTAVAGHMNIVDRSSGIYTIIVGASGAAWGLIIGLIGGLAVAPVIVRVAFSVGAYAVLLVAYALLVPPILITGWGPMTDVMASWLAAGLGSLPVLLCSVLASGVIRLALRRQA